MTDWSKENDEKEDEFYRWLDRDKEKYNLKHPKRKSGKKNSKRLVIFSMLVIGGIIFTVFFLINEFAAEKYFYISDYRLNKIPLFCVQEFEDSIFFDANKVLIEKTGLAISEWQEKIKRHTGNNDWKFEYKIISVDEQDSFSKLGCDTTIMFERFPPRGLEYIRGETAVSHYGFSDVVIFYLDPVSRNRIDPNIDFVIKHEMGHVLGLDHPIFQDEPYTLGNGGEKISRSIMVTPETYPQLPSNLQYTITDYDIRSIVNLYSGGLSSGPIFFGYLNYIIIGIILFCIAFIVNRKLKQYR